MKAKGEHKNKEQTDAWPSKKHDFQYTVISVGVHTKLISGSSTPDDHKNVELSHFPKVMEQTNQMYKPLEAILRDGLIANRKVCAELDKYEIVPYFLPKSNLSFKSKGVPL